MTSVYVAGCNCGRGIFAGRPFDVGAAILTFEGAPISLEQALAMGDDHINTLQVADEGYLDIRFPGVFVNHSCDPNAGVVSDTVLVALRRIAAGEEIRFDYSTTMLDGTVSMICTCRSPACRRVIGDFTDLPARLQAKYLGLGVVQAFIRNRVHAAREFAIEVRV